MIEHTSEKRRNARKIPIAAGALILDGYLDIPANARGIVLLAHGSRHIESDEHYADLTQALNAARLATLFVHLLTESDENLDDLTEFFRYNASILSQRMLGISNWLAETAETHNLGIGYFGIGPTGAAALIAGALRPDLIHAIVAGNGRIDLAQAYLKRVVAPTLFIVGEKDSNAVQLNQEAVKQLGTKKDTDKRVETIAGVSQLFETQEALQRVTELASQWFQQHLEPIV